MKKRTSDYEINALCGMLIEDFIKKFHYSNTRVIDIETFVTDYLGTKIVFETFDYETKGRDGFLSDGITQLRVIRDGISQRVIYPKNIIVINSDLNDPNVLARLRFTIAHEAGHLILNRHIPGSCEAAFHTEFTEGEEYSIEMLKSMLSIREIMSNKAAASLLMPPFIVSRALNTYNNGNKVTAYTGSDTILPDISKRIIQRMADSMGVSFTACYLRLKELSLFEVKPFSEYALNFNNMEAGNEQSI